MTKMVPSVKFVKVRGGRRYPANVGGNARLERFTNHDYGTPGRGGAAGGKAAESVGRDVAVTGKRVDQLRDVRRPDADGAGQIGGGMMTELADRTALVVVVVLAEGGGGRGAGQRDRQHRDPGAPARAASYEP